MSKNREKAIQGIVGIGLILVIGLVYFMFKADTTNKTQTDQILELQQLQQIQNVVLNNYLDSADLQFNDKWELIPRD